MNHETGIVVNLQEEYPEAYEKGLDKGIKLYWDYVPKKSLLGRTPYEPGSMEAHAYHKGVQDGYEQEAEDDLSILG